MTREEIYQRCEREIDRTKGVLLEAGTGMGKSRCAVQLLNHLAGDRVFNVLLLVAKTVHKFTWEEEFNKWGLNPEISVCSECYESLKKHVGESFDAIILDEVHHVQSELRMEFLRHVSFKYMIGLSATIPRKLKSYLMNTYGVGLVQCSLQDAIEDGILPEPEIMLLPLQLDNAVKCEEVEVNPRRQGKIKHDEYEKLWYYKKTKEHAVLKCTKKQRLQFMDNQIIIAKKVFKVQRTEYAKKKWLRMCGDRLKFLAMCKNEIVKELLNQLNSKRVLTFCTSIEQTEILGKNCIHSKNKMADDILNAFNDGKVNHITACQVLNEGVNLKECQYGVFANINASDIIKVQRVGRILRHEHPVVIIPYYVDSREEEIVDEWIEGYNSNLIHGFETLTDLIHAIKYEDNY